MACECRCGSGAAAGRDTPFTPLHQCACAPRLAAYPGYIAEAGRWLDGAGGRGSVAAAALRLADADGLARASAWSPGLAGAEPAPASFGAAGAGGAAHAAAPSVAGPSAGPQGSPGQPGSDWGRPAVLPRPVGASGVRAAETGTGILGLAGGSEQGGSDALAQPAAAAAGAGDARGAVAAAPGGDRQMHPAPTSAGTWGDAEAQAAAAHQARAGADAQRPRGGAPSALRDWQSAARSQEAAGAADAAAHAVGIDPGLSPAQAPLRPGAGSWAVAMGEDGLLVGAARPAPAPDLSRLLRAVLDGGHELSEADIVRLFAARGADFDAVCAAAGAPAARTCPGLRGMLCKSASAAFEYPQPCKAVLTVARMLAVCGALAMVCDRMSHGLASHAFARSVVSRPCVWDHVSDSLRELHMQTQHGGACAGTTSPTW